MLLALGQLRSRDWRLHLAGEGPGIPGLQELARSLGIEGRITWHGWLARDDLVRLIGQADVCLQPDTPDSLRVKGSSSLKVLEYIALGRWVLAGRCKSLSFLEEEGLGALVDAADVQAWAQTLDAAVQTRPKPPAGQGRRFLAQNRTHEAAVQRYLGAIFPEGR